ncbi:glycosyltransferase [Clostridium butyricum]|uniref:Glycosyltransferase n=1 Tax=Clostridium butyricum TaxID=1492 RepID=A0A6L9ESI7_CLOBU|nr:glycosyltransferase [Clostridium butyricum]
MKKLAIDCRSINKEKTGVGNVLINTLRRLRLENIEITLFFDREVKDNLREEFEKNGYYIQIIKCSNYAIWEQILLPIKIGNKYNYVWFPANTGSVFVRANKIATIHDVIFAKSLKEIPLSGVLSKDLARLYRCIFAKILAKTSKKIYTVSNYSRNDIISKYTIDSEKVKVIYNGLDTKFINRESNILKKDYILSFGSNEVRKNTELMIKVYKELVDNYCEMKDIKLILYGFRGYEKSKIKKMISNLGLENKVIVYKYVTDEQLIKLYREAKVFCFLSSFEGFGLPIIESMASKTPVVALNNSSVSEIVGDFGILISNNSVKNIANEINKLLCDKDKYKNLIDLGIKNTEKYNWDISIEDLSNDINQLINRKILD